MSFARSSEPRALLWLEIARYFRSFVRKIPFALLPFPFSTLDNAVPGAIFHDVEWFEKCFQRAGDFDIIVTSPRHLVETERPIEIMLLIFLLMT